MILRQLTLCNFLVFFGEQSLSFPSDEDENVTLILANNNTGKTSLIRALKFLFYGSKSLAVGSATSRPSSIINERAAHEATSGHDVEGYVELTFSLGDDRYRFRRSVHATRSADGLDRGDEKLSQLILGEDRVQRVVDDTNGALDAQLRAWMPRGLFDAFYFQGEPLDGKMLEGVGGMHQVLTGFLHIDKWEEAAEALGKAHEEYERQLSTIASASREYQTKLGTLQMTERRLGETKAQISKLTLEIQELDAREAVLSEELKALGNTEDYDRLVRRKAELRSLIDRLDTDIDRAHERLGQIIEASQGAPFLLPAVEPARRILRELEKNNVLPADITEGFVQRILKEKTCVCGRVHDNGSREHWERYLKTALSTKLSHRFLDVLNRVSEGSKRGPVELAAQTRRDLTEIQERIDRCKKDLHAARQEHEAVDEQIRQNPHANQKERIAVVVDGLRTVSRELSGAKEKRGTAEGLLNNLSFSAGKLRKEAETAKPKGKAAAQIAEVERAIRLTEELREFIADYRINLRKRFHEQAQVLVSALYDQHAVDRTRARIDPNSFLPQIINQEGKLVTMVGGGQQTLLSLAFVSALAQLRKGIHETMRELNLYLGKADDQSFMVDSPFAATDPNYVRAIASFLTRGARQVIILMARQQWDQAAQYLLPKASKVYALRLHSKVSELKNFDGEDFDFAVGKKMHRLIAPVSDVKLRYTEILEIA
jgi:DNA sulfur modification protein DndD